jgi:predicted DNA-binding transcriptional regulator AlpA
MTEPNTPIVLLTVKDLAQLLKISIRSVWRLCSSGEIPRPIKIGASCRWDSEEVTGYLQSLKGDRRRAA